MILSQADKDVLIIALSKSGSRKGMVLESSLEKKRRYNAAIKLANNGYIAHMDVTYQRVNGQANERYNRTWISGQSWNELKGKLTEKGVLLAQKLLS